MRRRPRTTIRASWLPTPSVRLRGEQRTASSVPAICRDGKRCDGTTRVCGKSSPRRRPVPGGCSVCQVNQGIVGIGRAHREHCQLSSRPRGVIDQSRSSSHCWRDSPSLDTRPARRESLPEDLGSAIGVLRRRIRASAGRSPSAVVGRPSPSLFRISQTFPSRSVSSRQSSVFPSIQNSSNPEGWHVPELEPTAAHRRRTALPMRCSDCGAQGRLALGVGRCTAGSKDRTRRHGLRNKSPL